MRIIVDLGKLKDGRNVIVLEKRDRIEYVLARNYNPDNKPGQWWSSGIYLYSLDALVEAITDINYGISYKRMKEITLASFDRLDECQEKDDFLYDNLSDDEREFFELE